MIFGGRHQQKLLNLAEDRPVAESMTELGEIKEMFTTVP